MIFNHYPEKHEVSEKAKEIGRRVAKRVVLKLLKDRDVKIAQLEAELAKLNYIELHNEQVSNVLEGYIAWKNKAGKLEAENERLKIINQKDGWHEKVLANYFIGDEFRQSLHNELDRIEDGEWVTLSIFQPDEALGGEL